MSARNYLAMDFGGTSGRGMLGSFDGDKLVIEELHRFPNYYVDVNDLFYWDVFRMYHHILEAMKRTRGKELCSIGIDTWGTDYGLLDGNGQLLGNCRCMRNADASVSEAVSGIISFRELFEQTGIQMIYGNTVFQLYERKMRRDPALSQAKTLLMLPDLLAYFLTGRRHAEYSMATTTMLYNPRTKRWDDSIMQRLGLPGEILPEIIMAGSAAWDIRSALLEACGLDASVRYIPVGTHDTASAVAAAPLQKGEAFCSSGTWSLFGVETDQPVLNEKAFALNFSNEGTVDGRIRLLKNIMGMWILTQCQEVWAKKEERLGWDAVVEMARAAPAHRCFIDLEDPVFYRAGNMVKKVQDYCRATRQDAPETVGEIARCVYESIALRYRLTVEQLEAVTGQGIKALRIVGGGGQNRLLNQFSANAMGIPVIAGPTECACAGNILMQAKARGDVSSFAEIRQVVARSFPMEEYVPADESSWTDAYEKYCAVVRARRQ